MQLTTFVSNLVFSSQCIAFHALQSALNFHSSGLRGKTFSTIRFNLLSIYFNHVQVEYNMRPDIRTIDICIQTNIFLYFYKYLFVFLRVLQSVEPCVWRPAVPQSWRANKHGQSHLIKVSVCTEQKPNTTLQNVEKTFHSTLQTNQSLAKKTLAAFKTRWK